MTISEALNLVDPRVGVHFKVGEGDDAQLCLFGFVVADDGRPRVDISTVDGADRAVLIVAEFEQTIHEVIAVALERHGPPSTWPVWASKEYVSMIEGLAG